MREDQLTLLVFLILDEYLYCIADLDVGIVAEFVYRDDAVALVADVNHCLTLVEGDDGTFDYFFVLYCVERLVISLGEFFAALGAFLFAFFIGFPVEVLDG